MKWIKDNAHDLAQGLIFLIVIAIIIWAFESGVAQQFFEAFSGEVDEDYTPGENFPFQ